MDQFSAVTNCDTNDGASSCLTGKKAFPTCDAAESFTTDAGKAVVGTIPEYSAAQQGYKNDPFTIRDGHYVAHDGFVVPKDFEEFYERYPDYVRKWVSKHVDRFATKQDLEDWTQDLLIHLCCLPQTSKHREHGKKDVVQVFDPVLHHGANEARFRNYINRCLANKFSTMRSKRMKDALCRPGNLSLGGQTEDEDFGSVGDEYCHSQSSWLQSAARASEKQAHDSALTQGFENFVRRQDPNVSPAIEALRVTGPQGDAAKWLGITQREFGRMLQRLRQLRRCFLNGEPVPKQRRPYKRPIVKTKQVLMLTSQTFFPSGASAKSCVSGNSFLGSS